MASLNSAHTAAVCLFAAVFVAVFDCCLRMNTTPVGVCVCVDNEVHNMNETIQYHQSAINVT